MRRALPPLLVALLLVTAGCAGLPGGDGGTTDAPDSATATATATATPTATPTPTPSLESLSYPDGASADGFENVSAVTRSGREVLNETSFGIDYEQTRTLPNGTEQTATLTGARDGERGVTDYDTEVAPTAGADVYDTANGTMVLSRSGAGQTVQYANDGSTLANVYGQFNLLVATTLPSRYLTAFDYEATETFQQDGHTFVVYRSTGVNESYANRTYTPNYVGGDLQVTLRDDGLVTAIEGTVKQDGDDGVVESTLRYEVTDVGDATVEKPDWVDQRATRLETTVIEDGKVVKLTHVGGPALEGATVSLAQDYASGSATIDSLEAGESVYLTATSGDEEYSIDVSVSSERPTPDSSTVTLTDADRVTVSVRTSTYQAELLVHGNATFTGT